MKFNSWLKTVPKVFVDDPLWKMKVYQYALFLSDITWHDISTLSKNKLLLSSSDQLYRSAGSVSANISEGYSRRSKLDQARFYEYALGSARECRRWYFNARHQLSEEVFNARLSLLTEIIKMLLTIIPKTRNKKIKEPKTAYKISEEGIEEKDFPLLE